MPQSDPTQEERELARAFIRTLRFGAAYNGVVPHIDQESVVEAASLIHEFAEPLRHPACVHCGEQMGVNDDACWSCYSIERDSNHAAAEAVLTLRERYERLEKAARGMLLSADCSWEENDGGHDWRAACDALRAILEGK